jgi:hypothetical protein
MTEALNKTGSAVLLDTYAQKTALRLGVSPESVRAEFKKTARTKVSSFESSESVPEPEAEQPPPSEREFWLLRFLLINDDHVGWVAEHLDLNWVLHPAVLRAVAARLDAHKNGSWRGVPALIDEMEDNAAVSLITEAVTEGQSTAELSRNLTETVRLLRGDFIDRELAALKLRIAQPGLLEADAVAILNEQSRLRRLKQQPMV